MNQNEQTQSLNKEEEQKLLEFRAKLNHLLEQYKLSGSGLFFSPARRGIYLDFVSFIGCTNQDVIGHSLINLKNSTALIEKELGFQQELSKELNDSN